MTSTPSRTSPISLLKGDGSLEPLHLRPGLFQPGFIVLARERCLFEHLAVAPGLNSRSAATAARLHADTAAPYQRYDSLITHKGPSYGIWWWDAQWVAERLSALGLDPATRVIPETLVRASGDGWRITKASNGYEAQLWKQGFLLADQWRKTPFDAAAWQDFARVQGDASGADSAVLMAQEAPWTLQSPYRRMMLTTWTSEKVGQVAVAAFVAAVLCLSLYLAGAGIGLKRNTQELAAQTAQLKSKAQGGQSLQNQVAAMSALKTAVQGPNAMALVQRAQEIVEPFGYKLIAFDATREGLTIVLPKEAVGDLEGISRELSASAEFTNVRPSLDHDHQRLTIAMAARGAPPKAKSKARAKA